MPQGMEPSSSTEKARFPGKEKKSILRSAIQKTMTAKIRIFFISLLGLTILLMPHLLRAQIPQEMRGIWVATVANIDWPSRPGLDAATQQQEARRILDQQKALGMNVVYFQIRPSADAFYESPHEPWSRFLSGQQGNPPQPYYDPLQFWIDEAHQRGLELHAWINPFRATISTTEYLHPMHPTQRHPEWVLRYGDRYYFDPGLPSVRQHILNVVGDIVTRYDIDGLHMDDYFYPYPLWKVDFPDTLSYRAYGQGMPRDDWRRHNVDLVIKSLHDTIKHHKPWVKYGISPFGVWRNQRTDPRGSDSRAGVECYDHLYADILKWEQEGWIDYVIPQIYWSIHDTLANYTKLLHWWDDNTLNRHLYIGHAVYKIQPGHAYWGQAEEIPVQIRMTRQRPNTLGSVFFSQKHFDRNDLLGLNDSIAHDLYRLAALSPNMPWIDTTPPQAVSDVRRRRQRIHWQTPEFEHPLDQAVRYIVYLEPETKQKSGEENLWWITGTTEIHLERRPRSQRRTYRLQIMAVDRMSNTSPKSKPLKIKY